MQDMRVSELRQHPQNQFFFDDMEGQKWKEFVESVRTSGVIEPLVVTQDKVIVSGHQRVRACLELGIEFVPCEVRIFDSEDEVLKQLIETNIRQRGNINSSDLKMGRIIKEMERIYGIKNGGDKRAVPTMSEVKSQEQIAQELGMSVDKLNLLKKLADLPQEYQDMVLSGVITSSVASRVIARLTDEEQTQLLSQLPITQKLTQAQVQAEVDKIKAKQDLEVAALRASIKQKEGMLEDVQAQVERLESEPVSTDDDLIAERDKYKQEKRDEYEKRQAAEKEMRDAEQRANKLEKEVSDLGRKLEKYVQLAEREPEIQTVEVEPKDYLKIKQELAASKEKIKNMEFINKHKDDLGVDGAHNAKYLLDTLAELNARLGACQYGDYINAPGNDQATINAALDQILEAQKLLQLISKKVEAEVA